MNIERTIVKALDEAVRAEVQRQVDRRLAAPRQALVEHIGKLREKANKFNDKPFGHILRTKLEEAEKCLRILESPAT